MPDEKQGDNMVTPESQADKPTGETPSEKSAGGENIGGGEELKIDPRKVAAEKRRAKRAEAMGLNAAKQRLEEEKSKSAPSESAESGEGQPSVGGGGSKEPPEKPPENRFETGPETGNEQGKKKESGGKQGEPGVFEKVDEVFDRMSPEDRARAETIAAAGGLYILDKARKKIQDFVRRFRGGGKGEDVENEDVREKKREKREQPRASQQTKSEPQGPTQSRERYEPSVEAVPPPGKRESERQKFENELRDRVYRHLESDLTTSRGKVIAKEIRDTRERDSDSSLFDLIQERLRELKDDVRNPERDELRNGLRRVRSVLTEASKPVTEGLKKQIEEKQHALDWDTAKKSIAGIDTADLENQARGKPHWSRDFAGIMDEYRDTALIQMDIAMDRVAGQDDTPEARKRLNEVSYRGWGMPPGDLEGYALATVTKAEAEESERQRKEFEERKELERVARERAEIERRKRDEDDWRVKMSRAVSGPTGRVEVAHSSEDARRAYVDFVRGERWCTLKRDVADLEKNPYYAWLEDDKERELFEIRAYIYGATNFKSNESGGSFEGALKNGYLYNLQKYDFRTLCQEDMGYKEGMAEYAGLADRNLTLLGYLKKKKMVADVGLTPEDVKSLEKHHEKVATMRREFNKLDFSSDEAELEALDKLNSEIGAAGESLRVNISAHLNLKTQDENKLYYVSRTLVDGVGFLNSMGVHHLEGFRSAVELKILNELMEKRETGGNASVMNATDMELEAIALDAEQMAFNTHKMFNTFESLDSKWFEREEKGKGWEPLRKKSYVFEGNETVNIRGYQMGPGIISALFMKGVRKVMSPLDNVVYLYLKGPKGETKHGNLSEWAVDQISKGSNDDIRKEIKENGGFDQVVLIDSFNARKMEEKCWTIDKYTDKGQKKYRLNVPDMYPPKLFPSYLESANLMGHFLNIFDGIKQDVPDTAWHEAKTISGFVNDGLDNLKLWKLYANEAQGLEVDTVLGDVDQGTNKKLRTWLNYAIQGVRLESRIPRMRIDLGLRDHYEELSESAGRKGDKDTATKLSKDNFYFSWDKNAPLSERIGKWWRENFW